MEPTNVMSDLLSAVTTVITSFVSWISTMTTSLIANPFVQLLFGMLIALLVYRLVIGLVKSAGFKKRGKRR